jgi:hypothetical protein
MRKKVALFLLALFVLPLVNLNIYEAQGATNVNISVDPESVLKVNDFATGFQLNGEWRDWSYSTASQALTRDANMKMVRIIDFKNTSPDPCTYWYEASRTGSFDWTEIDRLVERIFDVGAEPLIVLGSFSGYNERPSLPRGMEISSTGLPSRESFAAYAASWVRHFQDVGLPVRYYEIFNEAWYFFWRSWDNVDSTKLSNFVKLFDTTTQRMKEANRNVLTGTDSSMFRDFLDYFVNNGDEIDFLSCHKYDSGSTSSSDSYILDRVESVGFDTTSSRYSPTDAKQKWYNSKGEILPVIISETNLSYIWTSGSDPRIQKLVGAVWTGLLFRSCILEDVQFSLYYSFSSSKYYESRKATGGFGFGMVNKDDDEPWYPYYVHEMIGKNLAVGDLIVESTSSSSQVRTLAWIHDDKINLFVICKTDSPANLFLNGLPRSLTFQKVDDAVSYLTPRIQSGTTDASTSFYLRGYTVILFQGDLSSPPPPAPSPSPQPSGSDIFADGFESGNLNPWTGTYTTSGEAVSVVGYSPFAGAYHGQFTSNGGSGVERAYVYTDISEIPELYVRGYVQVNDGLPLQDQNDRFNVIALFGPQGGHIASVTVQQDGGGDKWAIRSQAGSLYATVGPSENRWYCVEFYTRISGSNGAHKLWIDGALIIDESGLDTNNNGYVDTVRFGLTFINDVSSAVSLYGDTFAISDSYIGPSDQGQDVIVQEDFESQNLNQWTGTETTSGETVSTSSYLPYAGNYHGRFFSNSGTSTEHAYLHKTVNEERITVDGYFRVVRGLPLDDNNDRFYFVRLRANDQSVAGFGIRRDNGVQKWMAYGRDGSQWIWPSYATSPQITEDRWYHIELHWEKDSNQGSVQVSLDGQKVFEISGINTADYGNIDSVQIGIVHDAGTQNDLIVYCDNITIAS